MTDEIAQNKSTNREFYQKFGDPWIWGIFIALILISLVENYSASSREIATKGIYMPLIKNGLFLFGGAVIAAGVAKCNYNGRWFLTFFIPILAIITVGGLLYARFFGEIINGAQRAINFKIFTFQPAECAKLSIVTLLAYIVAKNQKDKGLTTKGLVHALIAAGIYCGLIYNSGLTNCLLVASICFAMLLIGGAQIKKLLVVAAAAFVLALAAYGIKSIGKHNDETLQNAEELKKTEMIAQGEIPADDDADDNAAIQATKQENKVDRSETRDNRLKDWWNSDSLIYKDITGKNAQEMFSHMAQAHGGIFGVGIGQSRECSRLPLAFSDYIYSIIVEETGLVGGIIVLLLFLSLLGRATIIVRRCDRALPSMLIIGTAVLITLQALFHMAINTGFFPVSGQPLPLISNGGTAIFAMSAAFGIMLSVSRTIRMGKKGTSKKEEDEEVVLPEGLDAENPIQITPKNVWK